MTLHVYEDLEQGSDDWLAARRGIITASVVGRLVTPSTVRPASNPESRALIAQLAAERITGQSDHVYVNDDMMRGTLHEPHARNAYAAHHGVTVDQVGFMVRELGSRCYHSSLSGVDTTPLDDPAKVWRCHECDEVMTETTPRSAGIRLGASPDGLVGTDGGVEIKCPRAKTHIQTVLADEVPAYNMAQVQACLLVTGRKYWDFVSFCAGLPLYTKRVYPDPKWRDAIITAATQAEHAITSMVARWETATADLPATEHIPDLEEITF